MRIACPHCGTRDVQEFSYRGAAGLVRPDGVSADADAMAEYVYSRENPDGPHRELWFHATGCRAWLVVTRDTRTHAIVAAEAARPGAAA